MPLGSDNRLAAIVCIECPMVNHALEAVFLYLVALPVHPWPLGRRQRCLDLWGAPIHQGLALSGCDDDKVPGVLGARHFPRPTIDLGAILQDGHLGGRKACEAIVLVVIASPPRRAAAVPGSR